MNRSRDPKHYLQRKTPRREPAYPLATLAYYGPDDQTASKVVLSIVLSEGADQPAFRKQWLSGEVDAREDPAINREILEALQEHGAAKLALVDRIAGCPHEAGVDYPQGEDCPFCPFWSEKA